MSLLKLKFNATLDYQTQALQAVVDLFQGQPLAQDSFSVAVSQKVGGSQLSIDGDGFSGVAAVSNQLLLTHENLLQNLRKVQERNNLPLAQEFRYTEYDFEKEDSKGVYLEAVDL